MTITTKFDIGDEVWFLEGNKAKQSKITRIAPYSNFSEKRGISWELDIKLDSIFGGLYLNKYEDELFATKEELINSL